MSSDDKGSARRVPGVPGSAGKPAWLAELEAATGKQVDFGARAASNRFPVEVKMLRFRCAKTGLPYAFALKRDAADGRYVVHETYKGESTKAGSASNGAIGANSEIEISEVKDAAIYTCPHCGGGNSFVLCGSCGGLFCQGAVRRVADNVYFKCPGCGNEGQIMGQITTLATEDGTAARGAQASLPTSDVPSLRSGAGPSALQRPGRK